MRFLHLIPLFGFLLAIYWFLAMTMPAHQFPALLNNVIMTIDLPSGTEWKPTWGDLAVLTGIIALYIELFKATRTSEASIIDHLLSTIVLIGYLVFWLTEEWAGNSVFLILTAMSFLDVIAGFTITISTARRDLALGPGG